MRGYPDYFGQSIFMKFGGAKETTFDTNIVANDRTVLTTITGKGRIYTGVWGLQNYYSARGVTLQIKIDDVSVIMETPLYLWTQGMTGERGELLYITVLDDENYWYFGGIGSGYTFDESFEIAAIEYNGDTPRCFGKIRYALVS